MSAEKVADVKLREFEGNMHGALQSWHRHGGRETQEPAIAEMPFDDLLRTDARDREAIDRIQVLRTRWQELHIAANLLAEDPAASMAARLAAQMEADRFYEAHQNDFAALAGLDAETQVDDYDWSQRCIGARLVFRWILAEGFRPQKMMKRLFAVGRAIAVEPFTQLTMEEQAQMFTETKAAVSWRMKLLSGIIKLRGMMGVRLPGQKSPDSRPSYGTAQEGNRNRVNGHAAKQARQGSFLRSLHVPKTKSNPS